MENKNEGNETKIIRGDFNCTMDKIGRYGGKKTQRLYRCCSNYALTVDNGWKIYEERKTQIPLISLNMIGPLTSIQDRQGLYR